ncbi:hypothetical protein K449DRAFT_423275 [Hypoxylon sp. EC38]|nr:hypothetical protein K449DRAFT_423275 [Hypoxylon sp. EC38]
MERIFKNSSDLEYRDSESHEDLLPQVEHEKEGTYGNSRASRCIVVIPWLFCIVLLIALSTSILKGSQHCSNNSFWKPYEFKPATRDLPENYHNVRFDAALRYNESHLLYRPVTDPPYVGDPSPEIDAAWENLMGAVDVFVTPDEQKELGHDLWLDPDTGLHVGLLSVMHDLHCVNMIRMSAYPEYYPKMKHPTTKIHIEHCLDALRLSIMCTGDMVLIPTKDSDSRPFEAVFETVHACRDFSAIRDWSNERGSADPEKYPENAEKLKIKMGIS